MNAKPTGILYLASPYGHEDPKVREKRFHHVNVCASAFLRRGIHVFSPISHGHPISEATGLASDWQFWKHHARLMLERSAAMVIFAIDGWAESIGVQEETRIANSLGLPVFFVNHEWHRSIGESVGIFVDAYRHDLRQILECQKIGVPT